jgi:hypothetical protein
MTTPPSFLLSPFSTAPQRTRSFTALTCLTLITCIVWKVARSDSRNVKSGVKSDVDQTFYIYERSPDGKTWVRNPELDGHFIKEFDKAWQMAHAVTLDQLDVASHEGKSTTTESSAETGNRLSCISRWSGRRVISAEHGRGSAVPSVTNG